MQTDTTPALVSVVIPTFNRAHLICDALASVAVQTWPALEIIVVDDGSDDGTVATVQKWGKTNSRPLAVRILEEPHLGGNAARNTGIQVARGQYVAFLDSDDEWLPQKIQLQMAAIATCPDARAVYCGVLERGIGDAGPPRVDRRDYPAGDLSRSLLVADSTAPTSCYLVKTDLLRSVNGFDETLEARQDWDMWIRIAQKTRIAAVPEALTVLRSHGGPRTISDPSREIRAHAHILKKYAHLRKAGGRFLDRRAQAAFLRRTGRVHHHHMGSRMGATRYLLCALATWPFDADTYFALAGMALPSGFRARVHVIWNTFFGRTALRIRSH